MSTSASKFPVDKILQFVNRESLRSRLSLPAPFIEALEKFNIVKSKPESQYKIALATLADDRRVIQFIEKSFFCEEPLARSMHLCYMRTERPFRSYLRDILGQGKSLIAVDSEQRLIGLCLNQRYCQWHPQSLVELASISDDIGLRKLLRIWSILSHESAKRLCNEADLLANDQDEVFDVGLVWSKHESVLSDLLGKTIDLARDLNYSTARIDCTNVRLHTAVESLGMKRVFELPYENVLIDDGSCRRAITRPSRLDTHAASYHLDLKPSIAVGEDVEGFDGLRGCR